MTEDELLIKAAEERLAIVSKYDRGREAGAQIDSWEDPTFEIYHVTDRYGFIHDQRIPAYRPEDREVRANENRRLKKWVKMLTPNTWEREMKNGKLKRRIYKGVPLAIRGEVWSRLLQIKKTKEEQKGKYEEMRLLARQWSPDLRQIDLDVNRTYRDHLFFRERYGLKQQALFHVLAAYSVYNAEIGYCQGMSQIAALLLMYMNEEEAFWGLSNLMADSKWAMHGFFIPGFPKLLRFQQHHDKILEKLLPKLKKHLDRQNIDAGLYTLKWFFQCFLDRVPYSLTLRLWDIYLYDGENVLVTMAYALLKMHRRTLNRMGMEEIVEFLQIRLAQDFGYTDDAAVETMEKSMEELRRLKLDVTRPIPANELPQKPFGAFTTPSVDASIGRRRAEFTEEEKVARAAVVARMDLQVLSQAQGSYLSIDDVSFDPSFDDVSSSCVQRSSRSSLAGTSVTSAAEISTVSVAASQRLLEAEEDVHSTLSRNSVVSLDKDGQQTPTVVTECAVIHFQRQPDDEPPLDVSLPSQSPLDAPDYPTPSLAYADVRPSSSANATSLETVPLSPGSLETPTNADLPPMTVAAATLAPVPPAVAESSASRPPSSAGASSPPPPFQIMRIEENRPRSRQARLEAKDPGRHSASPDRVLIYVPFSDGAPDSPAPSLQTSPSNGAATANGLPPPQLSASASVSSSLTDPNRVVIHVERTGVAAAAAAAAAAATAVESSKVNKRAKSPAKKGAKSKTTVPGQSSRL